MIKRKVVLEKANRLYQMPPDILSMIRSSDKPTLLKKTDQIDLATFNWPLKFDSNLTITADNLNRASREQLELLRSTLAEWYHREYKVKLNPDKEVFIGGGITSLIFSIALAFLENGDLAFVPQVGLPLYRRVIAACGAQAIGYAVTQKSGWAPDFSSLTNNLRRVGQILFLNSPHNPTGHELSEKEMALLITMAGRENILLVNDAAYQSLLARRPVSLLGVAGGKQVGVEIGSFSYHFGLPRLPFGFVVGNREVISALNLLTSLQPVYISGFRVEQAIQAIRHFPGPELLEVRKKIAASEAEAGALLEKLSLENVSNGSVPFIWARIEKRSHARRAAQLLFHRYRLLVAPGTGFGDQGEGFLRFSLTQPADQYAKACSRIKQRFTLTSAEDSR